FQILASHVCARWRAITLTTPLLWTRIQVEFTATPPFGGLIAKLTRSQNQFIDILIDAAPSDAQSMPDAHLNQVIVLLAPHTARWRSFDLNVTSYHQLQGCWELLTVPLLQPPLHLVELIVENSKNIKDFPGSPVTFFDGNLPRLKSVILIGVGVDWEQRWLKGSPHLTDIELTDLEMNMRPSWEKFVRLLTESPQLQRLKLYEPVSWDWEPSPEHMSSSSFLPALPMLQTLELERVSQNYARSILTRLAFPSLANLKLELCGEYFTNLIHQLVTPPNRGPEAPPGLNSLLHGLKTLIISDLWCASHCVALLFRELRSIEHLTLNMTNLDHEFLRHIGCRGNQSSRLPTLRTLSTVGVTGELMREIVANRRHCGYPLRAVYMAEWEHMTKGEMERLRQDVDDF
ncbi:hypothetical protein BJ138DRAFT_978010, partial [Hygrophoropsis aurantiaca]